MLCFHRRLHQHQLHHDAAHFPGDAGPVFGRHVYLQTLQLSMDIRAPVPAGGPECAVLVHLVQFHSFFWDIHLFSQERQSKFVCSLRARVCFFRVTDTLYPTKLYQ